MAVRVMMAILASLHFQRRMRKARTLVLERPGRRQLNALRRIHIGAPREISPRIIRRVLLIMEPLGRMIRIRNPMTLLCPQEFGSKCGAARDNGDENQLRPHFHHSLLQRNRPALTLLVKAGRMNHLVNQNPCGLLLSVDIDAICRTNLRVAAIHVLGPQVLAHQRKLA